MWTKVILIFYTFLNVEIVFPHWCHSNFLIVLHKIARRISYIEDGLDTYRTNPKNIVVSELKQGANYYHWDLGFEPEKWTKRLKLVPVPFIKQEISATDLKQLKPLTKASRICVESPGLQPTKIDDTNMLVITHPSPHKRKPFRNAKRISENTFLDLECVLATCRCDILIGESYTALILIAIYKKENIIIYVDTEIQENTPVFLAGKLPCRVVNTS